MQVTYAHVCDYAVISDGKLSAMGIFDRIFANAVPTAHPIMHLAFEIALNPAEVGQPFRLLIKLVDQDGHALLELGADGLLQNAVIHPGELVRIPQTLALGGVPLPRFGNYSLDIFINGDHKRAVGFVVEPRPAVPGLRQ